MHRLPLVALPVYFTITEFVVGLGKMESVMLLVSNLLVPVVASILPAKMPCPEAAKFVIKIGGVVIITGYN